MGGGAICSLGRCRGAFPPKNLLKSDMISLQETWLEDDTIIEDLEIPGYTLHLNSYGKGKGIATYFKENIFKHDKDIKQE